MVDVVTSGFAVAAFVAFGFVGLVAVAGLLGLFGAGGLRDRVVKLVGAWMVPAAFVVGFVATLGSLWLSGSLPLVGGPGFRPCVLCWYQRILMYPLPVILFVGWFRQDRGVWGYAVPLAVVGAGVSVWHALVERFPSMETSCDPFNPCSLRWVEAFGFVTIPMMAFAGFAAVLACAVVARWHACAVGDT